MPKPTCTEAALSLMQKRGYVVIGMFPGSGVLSPGDCLFEFAGHFFRNGYYIRVTGHTTRKMWDRQVIDIFGEGFTDPNPRTRGSHFYRGVLVEPASEGGSR